MKCNADPTKKIFSIQFLPEKIGIKWKQEVRKNSSGDNINIVYISKHYV